MGDCVGSDVGEYDGLIVGTALVGSLVGPNDGALVG